MVGKGGFGKVYVLESLSNVERAVGIHEGRVDEVLKEKV